MNSNNNNTKKNQKKNKNTKKKAGNKKTNAISKRSKITAVASHQQDPGEGARQNIMIIAGLDESSVAAAPEALISMGYTRGWFTNVTTAGKVMYWAYQAFIADLVAILGSKVPPVSGRLEYLNAVLATYSPKSAPFKTSTLDYSWDKVDSVPVDPAIVNRIFRYYMYEQSNNTVGPWLTQVLPPNPPNNDDVYPILSALYTLLAREKEGKRFVKSADFTPEFEKDVSGFAAVSPYFGQGNSSSSSTAASCENEVPFKSNILANFTPYTVAGGRVARNFNIASGDSTAGLGYGMCPEFDIENYSTRYAPVYKFLDLDEIVYTIQLWYAGLVTACINDNKDFSNTQLAFALQPFTYTAQQFRIAIRQAVLAMFANSAALTQNIRYSNAPNSFEPFRVGSNCYPPILQQQFQLPIPLIENLRMLMMRTYDIKTKFHNPKNKLYVVPVWGVFKTAPPPNVFDAFLTEEGEIVGQNMFGPSIPEDPNIIDGTNPNDDVCDLNRSPIVTSIISEWNDRIKFLRQYSVPTGPLGGDGNGVLLTITRYCTYTQQEIDIAGLSRFQKGQLPKEHIMRKRVQRTVSKTNMSAPLEEKEVYVPPAASLASQYTSAFSSVTTITDTIKQMLSYFVYPHIVLENNGNVPNVPTSPQNRTYTVEGSVVDIPKTVNSLDSTRNRLQNFASAMVVGTAGSQNEELASLVKHLNDTGLGGFLSQVIQQLAPLLPF